LKACRRHPIAVERTNIKRTTPEESNVRPGMVLRNKAFIILSKNSFFEITGQPKPDLKMQPNSLTNKDLAVVPKEKRTWGVWNYAALWISMSLCIPTYMLASSLIGGGMNWWQAILTIFLGNLIVLVPMILNGRAGAKYGIPFPVLARASFGVRGANIPALLRAIVACGWFGIQTWIGGFAIFQMLRLWIPRLENLPEVFPTSFQLHTGPAICFFLFWLLNMFVVYLGVESIRKLLVFKAVFLPLAALALLFWAISAAHGLGPILNTPSRFTNSASFWNYFFPALTGMIGFWATLSLNIPDFTRYAKSQKAQVNGQSIGLPTSMTLFAFIGVVVTSATMIIYGETIWDPVVLAGKFENKMLVSIAMIAVAISTLATNIAANIVSPANDFSNLAPQKINFRAGGFITGIMGILIFPWKLIADPSGYIFTWLVGYSSLLGPIGGIMIADYFFIRRQTLKVDDLYQPLGSYTYAKGFNLYAVAALLAGILPNVPGFLVTIHVISKEAFPLWITGLYNYAWFVGFFISGLSYLFLMRKKETSLRDTILIKEEQTYVTAH
jgi:nucleobase:cation symporter-1, NCS1 family